MYCNSFQRKNGQLDEEGLKISGEILAVNPDFYTLWNFRKEIFVSLQEKRYKSVTFDSIHFVGNEFTAIFT